MPSSRIPQEKLEALLDSKIQMIQADFKFVTFEPTINQPISCIKLDLVITHQVLGFGKLREQELKFDNLSFRDAEGGLRSFCQL